MTDARVRPSTIAESVTRRGYDTAHPTPHWFRPVIRRSSWRGRRVRTDMLDDDMPGCADVGREPAGTLAAVLLPPGAEGSGKVRANGRIRPPGRACRGAAGDHHDRLRPRPGRLHPRRVLPGVHGHPL